MSASIIQRLPLASSVLNPVKEIRRSIENQVKLPEDISSVITYDPKAETPGADVGMSQKRINAIWKSVEGLYNTGMHPAITFCLRVKGQIVLNRAIGHASGNGPKDRPETPKTLANPDTPICLFSLSKAITAMLIHLLVQRDQVHLMDPVCHYIPEFKAYGKKNITIWHVLTHQSGFPTLPASVDREIIFDLEKATEYVLDIKPIFRPGTIKAYHAVTGGHVLAEVIRRVTGTGVREFLEKEIAKPMGMRFFSYGLKKKDQKLAAVNYSTGFPLPYPISVIAKRALTLSWDDVVEISNDPRFMDTVIPSANAYCTAEELSRFFQMIMDDGRYKDKEIFDPVSVKRALTPIQSFVPDLTLAYPVNYTPGLMKGGSPFGPFGPFSKHAFGHWGFMNSIGWADPSRDISVAILATGKTLLSTHLPALGKFLTSIAWNCA